jgi:hypothetical protein
MSTPSPVVSNTVTVTEAGATPTITISASPTSLPDTGGIVSISGTTNEPDGTAFELYANGVDTGVGATSAGGTFGMSYTVPANTGIAAQTISLVVTTGGPPPAPAAPAAA